MMPWTYPGPPASFLAEARRHLPEVRARTTRPEIALGSLFEKREIWAQSYRALGHKGGLVDEPDLRQRCYWCEQVREWKRELDVEHLRPKSEVSCYLGQPPIAADEPPPEVSLGPGYWWLAFEWTNYALSCKSCNAGWKRNLFPREADCALTGEGCEAAEVALLLLPGRPFRTEDHFRWLADGHMEPLSPSGYATLVTCGLNRSALVAARRQVMWDIRHWLDTFTDALRCGERPRARQARARLRVFGDVQSEFAGMARWLVLQQLGRRWEDIPGLGAPLAPVRRG